MSTAQRVSGPIRAESRLSVQDRPACHTSLGHTMPGSPFSPTNCPQESQATEDTNGNPEVHLSVASAILAAGDQDLSASDRAVCNRVHVQKLLDGPCPVGRGRAGDCSVCEAGWKVGDVLAFRRIFDGMGASRRAAFISRSYEDAKGGSTRCKWIFLDERCCE